MTKPLEPSHQLINTKFKTSKVFLFILSAEVKCLKIFGSSADIADSCSEAAKLF